MAEPDWTGDVEHMPFPARIDRLRQLADAIEAALRDGPLTLRALFEKVASTHRIAISQVKPGLTYALYTRQSVALNDSDDTVSLTAGTP